MQATKLTQADLEKCFEDDRYLGFGYGEREVASESKQRRMNVAVVAAANRAGLDYDDLADWVNSKFGRWYVDGVYGCGQSASGLAAKIGDEVASLREEMPKAQAALRATIAEVLTGETR